jgi:hypothetical protein
MRPVDLFEERRNVADCESLGAAPSVESLIDINIGEKQ